VVAESHYTRTAVGLHWLIAALITCSFTFGWIMTDMDISPLKLKMFNWHKWVGITILGLAMARIVWRLTHKAPAMVAMSRWQHAAAHALHGVLYLLLLAMPLSGWIYSNAAGYPIVYLSLWRLPNLVEKNKELANAWVQVHGSLAFLLALCVAVHLLAALVHHFWHRDDTLRRMLRWRAN
jgi:cytochrome b561